MTATRGYEVDDLFRLKGVSDPQISPDGTRVAFVLSEIDKEADANRSAIWIVGREGGEPRRATFGANDSQPRWSPDGRHLAFVSNRDAKRAQVFVLPLAGGEARRLTDAKSGVLEYAWSPAGTAVAFTARTGGPEESPNGTPPPRVVTTLKYKFNGLGFFDGSHRHVFVVGLEGGEARQLTDGDWDDGQIDWSPDGRQIAFVSARHESRDRDAAQDLWVVPAAGGESRRLTGTLGPCHAPAFSPDGQTIAFAGHTEMVDTGGRPNALWLMPAAGGEARRLTAGLDRSTQAGPAAPGAPPARFAWSAEGNAIVARVEDSGAVHLDRFSVADLPRSQAATPPAAGGAYGSVGVKSGQPFPRREGTASPHGEAGIGPATMVGGQRVIESFSMARDGSVACAIADHRRPTEVFLLDAAGKEQRLTGFNDELMAGIRLPEVEPVRVPLPDGATIEGWVFKPLDMEPGKRYPLVLDVHGGPHGAFMYNFRGSYPLVLAAQGYGVLQMNPRGSTGWGEAFARHLHGGRGERDLPELLAAVDQVVEQGWVDPERLGITGYSYGGYMTAWAISQTDRFKAAVWGAGTANLYTHFAYSDLTAQRYAEMAGSPWEQREAYLRASPISYVLRITTPLLMLHGEADLRCNIAQAEEFFTALKYFGKEVEFVRYPGEHHGFRMQGKPSNRADYDRRLLAWFAERLGAGPAEVREAAMATGRT